jgi:hypothetical protein
MPESIDHVIRFVHSDYTGQPSDLELATVFPTASDIAIDAMPLRAIFLAIAKSGRVHNRSSQSQTSGRRSEA